jgi:uncharacterized protein
MEGIMATHLEPKPAGTPTWIDLMTPDGDAARAFYHSVFGWEYDIGGPEFGGYTTARIGNRSTAGIVGNDPNAPAMPAAWSLYFASNDLDTDVARAVELGAKVLYPAMAVSDFGSMATLADPTGAMFSFWQAGSHVGSQMVNEPGSTAWFELYASNAAQARDFYTALLGATAELMPGGLEYYVLKHGDDMICAIMQIDPSWGQFPSHWITYFGVVNVDDTIATITKLGGKALSGIDDSPFGRFAAVMDAQGAQFKIVEV